ncbi:serine protease 30-like [Micractinium conductrix]|uniref:Serine protease 30-like n=1 Tax=Micractinium conductrix TaxID=554055 RepID=A0A2P6V9C9_9CHLO|nr:serine protease 30-like [Micractinium conductrix]|eukprot:PSC70692.1 serine protease 30-like [Micractinium conductrix]
MRLLEFAALAALVLLAAGLGAAGASEERRALISNGENVPPGRYPYYCAVGRAGRDADTVTYSLQHCGGTLIHPQVVLTAAHCTADEWGRVLRGLSVLCNSTRLGVSDLRDGVAFQHVAQALLHPNSTQVRGERFDQPKTLQDQLAVDEPLAPAQPFTEGDLALLLLEEAVEGAVPVAVATTAEWEALASPGLELRVVGFGAIEEGRSAGSFPRTLQEAALPLVSSERCRSLYRRAEFGGVRQYIDSELALCAGFSAGARSLPCSGDSGGPLLYTPEVDDPATHLQVGIVSGGAGECDGPSLPGVFLRLDTYWPWIQAGLQSVDSSGQLPAGAGEPGAIIAASDGAAGGEAATGNGGEGDRAVEEGVQQLPEGVADQSPDGMVGEPVGEGGAPAEEGGLRGP